MFSQPAQPPPNPPPGPNGAEPPPGNPQDPQRRPVRAGWYNGDYAAETIPPVVMIDDPVTGFGNEALWSDPPPLPDRGQSDVAASPEPD